jgi:hypothetical protein
MRNALSELDALRHPRWRLLRLAAVPLQLRPRTAAADAGIVVPPEANEFEMLMAQLEQLPPLPTATTMQPAFDAVITGLECYSLLTSNGEHLH